MSETSELNKLNQNTVTIAEKYNQVVQKLYEKYLPNIDEFVKLGFSDIISILMLKLFANPSELLKFQLNYCQAQLDLLSNLSEAKNIKDRRFSGEIWSNNLFYSYIKQSYFLTVQHMEKIIDELHFESLLEKQKCQFYIKQLSYALSPTNYFFTNPEISEEFYRTDGESLIRGLDNLLHDIEKSSKLLNITTSCENKFAIGENVACSKGEVVFQNELMQLINYHPKQQKCYQVPLLIIPPWINKYYILDLSPNNSYVSWCLEQGYNVFLISWVNPSNETLQSTFEDYMFKGVLAALDFIEKALGTKSTAVIGYCLGGTLLTMTMAFLANKKEEQRIASATMLTTMIDFDESGDMSLFVDDNSIKKIEEHLERQGYLDGSEMLLSFSLLRANDMIWHFYINNYLLGKEPFPFDILYWNSDSTRLPGKMHSFYLRNMYNKNLLKDKGKLNFAGVDLDVSKIKTDCYFLATIEDHIAPWKACFKGIKLISGNNKFILGGSGHVAGVINHPDNKKYFYYENERDDLVEEWLKNAVKYDGSWWNNWSDWQQKYIGKKIMVSDLPKITSIEPAPGSYVKQK